MVSMTNWRWREEEYEEQEEEEEEKVATYTGVRFKVSFDVEIWTLSKLVLFSTMCCVDI